MAIRTERAQKTNAIALSQEPVRIISVQGKRADQTFFTSIQSYSLNGKDLIARRVYDEIKVEYEDGVQTEFQKGLEKDFLNSQVSFFGGSIQIDNMTSAGTTAKSQRDAVEVSKNGSVIGLNVGGLVSLVENVQERITTTDEPVLSILTDTVENVNLSEISTSKNDITTLTGKTTSDGFLKLTITTGSPSGLNNALKEAGVKESKRRAALQTASTVPDVVTISVNTDRAKSFANVVQKTIRSQSNAIGNPVGSFKGPNLGGFGFGALGLPQGNMLGNLIGKLLNVDIPSVPNVEVPSIAKGIVLPQGEPFPPNVIESTGQTNISKTVRKSTIISPNVKNTTPPLNVATQTTEFEGALSTDPNSGYVFEYVGGPEELKFELTNSTREITTMVVHWTRTPSDWNMDAAEVSDFHFSIQRDAVPSGTTTVDLLRSLGVKSGIQYHYVIRKDGSIQRGRPLDLESFVNVGFNKYAVHVGFVAGFTCPSGTPNKEKFLSEASITPEQWKSFDQIVKAFDSAKNGGAEFVGLNQFPASGISSVGPGFSVPEYMSSKYNKSTVYLPEDFKYQGDALSPEEIVNRKPAVEPVKPTRSNTPLPDTAAVDDLGEYVPSQTEIDSRNAEYEALVKTQNRLEGEEEILRQRYYDAELDPNTTTEQLAAIEEQFDKKHYDAYVARTEVQKAKTKLINDQYIYVSKDKKWVHGTQYRGQ